MATGLLSTVSGFKPTSFAGIVQHRNPSARFSTDVSNEAFTEVSADVAKTDVVEEKPKLQPEFEFGAQKILEKVSASEHLDDKMLPMLTHFIYEYMGALNKSNLDQDEMSAADAAGLAAKNIGSAIEFGVKYGSSYKFGLTHEAIREPFDYYEWGCNFFKPAMNMKKSVFRGGDVLKTIVEQLEKGENVVFLANHQSEADPQVVSAGLEAIGYGDLAAQIVYVAGHKVTTDALAIPFSMGRNLICIHSKKHLDSDPDTKEEKGRQNRMAMSAMLEMFKNEKGVCIWVAPSGGRDRRDLETGEVPLAKFDQKTVDLFRLMARKSKVPTHFHPMSMVSYDLCPPPDGLDSGVGEERNVRYGKCAKLFHAIFYRDHSLTSTFLQCQLAFRFCPRLKTRVVLKRDIYLLNEHTKVPSRSTMICLKKSKARNNNILCNIRFLKIICYC